MPGLAAETFDPKDDMMRESNINSSALTRSTSGSAPGDAGSSAADKAAASPMLRMSTWLQTGKIQPKQYKNMIRYANLTTSGEPKNLDDAFKKKIGRWLWMKNIKH
jgi:hypothetical protein